MAAVAKPTLHLVGREQILRALQRRGERLDVSSADGLEERLQLGEMNGVTPCNRPEMDVRMT